MKKKTALYLAIGWALAAYPLYLILDFASIFLSKGWIIGLGLFIFVVGTGTFLRVAEDEERMEKVDKVLDEKLNKH